MMEYSYACVFTYIYINIGYILDSNNLIFIGL